MVLGVTNLFFLKSLAAVPHVVSVGAPPPQNAGAPAAVQTRFSPGGFLNKVRMKREGPLCLMTQHKEAIFSGYVPVTKPDTGVLNRLVDAGTAQRIEESMAVVNNDILRRHFVELTTNFLAPFGPYLRASAPLEGSSPFVEPTQLPQFRVDEFLNGLAERGPGKFLAKRMKSNWLDLYRRFLEGKNFMSWFQSRRAAAEQEQRKLYRQARINCDIQKLISRMSEVEIVDSFNAIERHLLAEIQFKGGNADSSAACQKLKGDLQAVFNVLPKDMQQLLLFNPKRASLIQGKISLGEQSTKLPGHIIISESPRTPGTPSPFLRT
ncbi:protein DENND6A isoform X2 [Asparagus officinalis]|uniref:protein DENND6A isoform X2 n=1 Tax=Asparagus officinalis TaxID=4686 RepID=UPI00098DFAB0|nr:protein DENND6A isoform X2 [Asparagus officinalis]